jgi:hypothetical protein
VSIVPKLIIETLGERLAGHEEAEEDNGRKEGTQPGRKIDLLTRTNKASLHLFLSSDFARALP